MYIFLSTCSKTKYRNTASESLQSQESEQNCLISVRVYIHISSNMIINIKYNARLQVLTPVLLRVKFSGMKQCVNGHGVLGIFRNNQTFMVKGIQSFNIQRTAHPTIQSYIPTDLNNHHTKFCHKCNRISFQSCPQPLTQVSSSRAILWTEYKWKNNTKLCLTGICCEVVNWIQLSEHRDLWRALGNTVMYFLFYTNTDVPSLRMTRKKGWKHVGVPVF